MARGIQAVWIVAVVLVAALGPVGTGVVAGAGNTDSSCGFPVTSTDATGTDVTISEEPQRIVTLAPSAAQTMWEIGGKEKVVGVSSYASYLDGADSRTVVADAGGVSVESVVALQPDLVLAPNVISEETVAKLRDAGLTVYHFEFGDSIEFIYEKTLLTGELTGECAGAEETVDWMKAEVDAAEQRAEGEPRPRVLYTFFGYTAGSGTYIDEIIDVARGSNVAKQAGIQGYAQISDEVVIEQDPQWIALNSDDPSVPQTEAYQGTTAVEKGQTVVLDANYVSQPAPRIVYPIRTLSKAMHPAVWSGGHVDDVQESQTLSTSVLENGSIALTVEHPENETVEFDVPDAGDGTTPVALRSLTATVDDERTTVDLTVSYQSTNPASSLDDTVSALGYVRVDATAAAVGDLQLQVSVDRDALPASESAAAESLVAYRYDDGDWTALDVESFDWQSDAAVFDVQTSGPGVVAVGLRDSSDGQAEAATVRVTAADLDDTQITAGEPLHVTARVEHDGSDDATRTVNLSVDGDVAASKTVQLSGDDATTVGFDVAVDEPGAYRIAVDGQSAGTVTVEARTTTATTTDSTTRTSTSTTSTAEQTTGDATTSTTAATATSGQPGFTPAAAVGALLVAAVLVARRHRR